MLPAITPPTDNLYKFLSLFGLTIFLFAGYTLGIVWDNMASNSMKMEDIKVSALKQMYLNKGIGNEYLESDAKLYRFRSNLMNQELDVLEKEVVKAKLPPIVTLEITGKIRKLHVQLQSLTHKRWFSGILMGVGIIIMVAGFLRWMRREQKLRDNILIIEHAMKEREKASLFQKSTETITTTTVLNQTSSN